MLCKSLQRPQRDSYMHEYLPKVDAIGCYDKEWLLVTPTPKYHLFASGVCEICPVQKGNWCSPCPEADPANERSFLER